MITPTRWVTTTRKEGAVLYFKNPPKKKRKRVKRSKARAKKRTVTRKKRRVVQSRKRKARKSTTKRRGSTMARKRKARRGRRKSRGGNITLKRISGKVYRSNPPILKAITGGLKDAAMVKAGQVAGTMASNLVPVSGIAKTGVKAVVAGAMVFLPVSGDSKRFLIAGAMQPVIDDLLALAGLSGLASGAGVSAYLPDGVSAYLSGTDAAYVGEDSDVGAYVDY